MQNHKVSTELNSHIGPKEATAGKIKSQPACSLLSPGPCLPLQDSALWGHKGSKSHWAQMTRKHRAHKQTEETHNLYCSSTAGLNTHPCHKARLT